MTPSAKERAERIVFSIFCVNTQTGEVVEFSDPFKPEPEKDWVCVGDIVEFRNARWRVTGMKPNGRLFLKLVKQ